MKFKFRYSEWISSTLQYFVDEVEHFRSIINNLVTPPKVMGKILAPLIRIILLTRHSVFVFV